MDAPTSTLVARVQPGARHEALEWRGDGELRVRVTAPAESGKANAALVELLARALDVRRGDIRLVMGWSSRRKVVEVPLSPDVVEERLTSWGERPRLKRWPGGPRSAE